MRRTLSKYLLLEQIPSIGVGLLLFTFILLSSQMLRSVSYLMGVSVPFLIAFEGLLSALPHIFLLTVPMACLLGILMTYGRLAEQGEIIGMMAGGVSYFRIMGVAVFLGVGISIGLFFWSDAMIPRSFKIQGRLAHQILNSLSQVGIQEGVFITQFPDLILYTKHYDREKSELQGVVIYRMEDKTIQQMILAPRGTTHFDPETRYLSLHLNQGSIYQLGRIGKLGLIRFDSTEIRFNVQSMIDRLIGKGLKSYPGFSMKELREEINRYRDSQSKDDRRQCLKLKVEYHRRMALPMACGVVSLLAVPLGILMGRGKRAILFIISIGMITAYYFLLASGIDLSMREIVPPVIGVWLANGLLFVSGILLNIWAARRY